MRYILPLLLLPALGLAAGVSRADELLVTNGTIYTMDPAHPTVEAVVVSADRIAFAGDLAAAREQAGERARLLDLGGKTLIPGFIESHGHLMALGYSLAELNLTHAQSYAEIVDMVRAAASHMRPGEWIIGNGWHQDKWSQPPEKIVKGFQTHEPLSAASPRNPVLLNHASGHAIQVNAMAMKLAGITRDTGVTGGEVIRADDGEATGILTENAMQLVQDVLPARTPESNRKALARALGELARNGITSFEDAGASRADIETYRALIAGGPPSVRLWVMLAGWEPDLIEEWLARGPEIDHDPNLLTIRAIKLIADGALGSRGAWMLEPYSDRPGHYGSPLIPMQRVLDMSRKALSRGFQMCVHAIGDRTNREVLDQFETAFGGRHSDARFRIEHAQHLDHEDIPRFGQLGVIASMQGIHLSSDRPWAIDRLGMARIEEGTYVWRKLLDAGAIIANGTDVPVEPVNPIASFYALVTRKTLAGTPEGGYEPSQKLTRAEALRAYTRDAAYAAFEEDIKGSIEPGKLADFTVLSGDLMTVPEDQLLALRVERTIVGGRTVFDRAHQDGEHGVR